jgi:ABC-type molybdate transport system substrate-binding protein
MTSSSASRRAGEAPEANTAIRFPASVNMSEAIRNAATVPGTAKNPQEATAFVAFLLSPEGKRILQDTGQPPVVPRAAS